MKEMEEQQLRTAMEERVRQQEEQERRERVAREELAKQELVAEEERRRQAEQHAGAESMRLMQGASRGSTRDGGERPVGRAHWRECATRRWKRL